MDRPNILLIVSDDHCANAVSAYPSSRLRTVFQTPRIDRLAAEGALLSHCYCANAICTPSRASMLTGQHSHLTGVRTLEDPLPAGADTFPKRLQSAGYQTALFGKWHLHARPEGFDAFKILPGQGVYHNPRFIGVDDRWPGIGPAEARGSEGEAYYPPGTAEEGYVSDLITDHSLDWLKRRDRDQPFLLLCHHKAPHDFFEYHERDERLLDGVEIPEPANLWEDKSHRPDCTRSYGTSVSDRNSRRNAVKMQTAADYPTGPMDAADLDEPARRRAAYQKYLKDYLRTVKGIDDNVGRLLDYLDEDGCANDTIVIYTSDQGMFLGEHDFIDKRWIYEEAMQIPFLIRYPKEIPAGSACGDLISNIDLSSTLLDYAGEAPLPSSQGRSFRQNLVGSPPSDWPRALYYRYWMHMHAHDNPAHYGIRTKDYKLAFFYGLPLDATGALPGATPPGWEMYDLANDPDENINVYDQPESRAARDRLRDQLEELKQALGDTDERYPQLRELALSPR